MNHPKEINIKLLGVGMYATLLFSFLWLSLTNTYFYSYSLGEFMYLFLIGGYIEVAIGNSVLLFLLHVIKSPIIRRCLLFIIWLFILCCPEIWLLFFIEMLRPYSDGKEIFMYLPAIAIKMLFFIYYKYKVKQNYKKTQ